MSIEKRGNNKWRFRITKDGQKYTKTFDGTQAEAKRAHKEFLIDVERGQIGTNENMKFKELAQLVHDEYVKIHCRIRTQEIYQSNYNNHILPIFGEMKISNIKPLHIQKLVNEMGKIYKSSTISSCMSVLSRTFDMAEKWGLLKESPYRHIDLPKRRKNNNTELLSIDEIKKLLDLYENESNLMHKSAFYLAIGCGLRNSEIRALTLDDIDFKNNIINVNKQIGQYRDKNGQIIEGEIPTKTEGSTRKIYAPNFVMETLKQYIDNLPYLPMSKQIFWSHLTRKPISKHCLSKRFTNLLKNNDLPNIRFHDLRHLQATLLIHSGVDIQAISNRLGHSQIRTTLDVYTHGIDEIDRQAVSKLEGAISEIKNKAK